MCKLFAAVAFTILMAIPLGAADEFQGQEFADARTDLAATNLALQPGNPGKANDLIQRIACDRKAAARCQEQAHGCNKICKTSNDPDNCWQTCLNRYKMCKVNAGCGSL